MITDEEVDMALAAIGCLEAEFERRAQNDPDNLLVWQCAADVARDLGDNLLHLALDRMR